MLDIGVLSADYSKLNMDFSSVLCICVAILFLSMLWLFKSRNNNAVKSPPEAAGSRPLIGHLHILGGGAGELPHIKLGTLADNHGPIFSIRLGLRRAVVVSDFELIKELFTVHDLKVSSRPRMRASQILSHDYAMFGFHPYGTYWRELRKLVNMELLSGQRIEAMRPVRESEIGATIRELYEVSSSDGSEVEMKKWFQEFSSNMTLIAVAGKRFDVAEKDRLAEAMKDFFRYAGIFVPADAWPVLSWLDIGGFERKMKETAKELEEIVGQWLVEAEHRRKEYSGEDKPGSFMDVLLSVLPSANIQTDRDAHEVIRATCEAMILGGIDTTTITLTWALSLLLNHATSLKIVQEELDNKIGRNRLPNESDLQDLVYLRAIIKETIRLYPPAPLGSPREFSEDCIVNGFHIRKGTWLIINMWKLHRDPRTWQDESEFKPERFLDEHKNMDVRGHDFELIPFGAGRRICPGINFGLQMVHMVLASLLHAFEIKPVGDELVDMSESIGFTNYKASPLPVVLKPRLAQNVYMGLLY